MRKLYQKLQLWRKRGQGELPLHNLKRSDSAVYLFNNTDGLNLLFAAILCLLLVSLNWHAMATLFISLLTVLYFVDLLFNLFLIFRSFSSKLEITAAPAALNADRSWPMYTILCPLYKEWNILPQFVHAIEKLDYPRHSLQVILLLEEDDIETIKRVKAMKLPAFFDALVVPHSIPKTKPKALNVGLKKAKGQYVVIYDAEDVPDPLQLKKAVVGFENSPDNRICLQAKLNFYNPCQNILTRLFASEYAVWFEMVLTGLQSINAPIPLGGTSNHFRKSGLLALSGWDPFNVTEDADLGIRIAKRGYSTAILDSTTLEEANSNMLNWVYQRSRWIKGYIQTYIVHNRSPKAFIREAGLLKFIFFQLVIGGKILSILVNPLMWAMTVLYFVATPFFGSFIQSLFIAPVFYLAVLSLLIGNFLYFYYYMIGIAKRNQWELIIYTLFTPFYWLGMSIGAYVAIRDIILQPHHWRKTAHGLHLHKQRRWSLPKLFPFPKKRLTFATS